jgi:hypothetical protein
MLFFIAFISGAHARIKIAAHCNFSAALLALVGHITQQTIEFLDLLCRLVLGVWRVHID